MSLSKKILFINRSAPYGRVKAQEALDAILMASAFAPEISLLFIDDGVFLLKKEQHAEVIGLKNFSLTYKALALYEIKKIYVDEKSLNRRDLNVDDLMIDIEVVSSAEVAKIMQDQHAILSF